MPPKKQKQSLADFLADETFGGKVDWSEDIDELPLGPTMRDSRPRRGGDYLSSMPDRVDRDRMLAASSRGADRYPPRDELPLPDKPPYTAFVGNLAFDLSDADLADFFLPDKVLSVRMPSDREGRPKGFGYLEFETLDGLKNALAKSGSQMGARTVRVSVAEAPKSSGGGFGASVAEEASQWRRAGPLPHSEPPAGAGRRASDRPGFSRLDSGPSGFDQMDVASGGRSGFGTRFTPAGPGESGGAGPGPGGPIRRMSERTPAPEPSIGDGASNWRTGKPVETMAPPAHRASEGSVRPGGPRRGGGGGGIGGDATEVDERFASQERMGFGSKFTATPPESPAAQAGTPAGAKRPGFGFDARRGSNQQQQQQQQQQGAAAPPPPTAGDLTETWRSSRKPSLQATSAASPPGGSPGPPAERKKLELKPRSVPLDESAQAAAQQPPQQPSAATGPSKANPFGAARPVDAAEREREIEERLAREAKERREKERAREERQREEREKAQASTAAAAAAAGGAAAAAQQPPRGPRRDRERASAAATAGAASTSNSAGSDAGGSTTSAAGAAPSSADAKPAAAAAAAAAPAASKAPERPPQQNAWRRGPPSGQAPKSVAVAGAEAAPAGKAANATDAAAAGPVSSATNAGTPAQQQPQPQQQQADRATPKENGTSVGAEASKEAGGASGGGTAAAPETATSAPPAAKVAAPAPAPAPTGAWGKSDRKPTGALARKAAEEAEAAAVAAAAAASTAAEGAKGGAAAPPAGGAGAAGSAGATAAAPVDKGVEEATKAVEKVEV